MRTERTRRRSLRPGYTLLEVFLVLIITGVLLAAIGSALHIHLRVAEVGRTEVEQAQLARALLRRIADDLRGAVPHIEPVASTAGATSDSIASAVASASSALGGTGSTGGATGSSTGGGTTGGSSTGASGGSSSGGSSSGNSGTQTLQPLKTLGTLGTLSALKPQSASSASSSSSGSSSSGASGKSSSGSTGSSSGSSASSSGGKSSSGTDTASDTSEETSTAKPPGIYGDQYSLQIDVSRLPRAGAAVATSLDAPGDVKTVGYYLAPVIGATDATGSPAMGLYRQSFDKAVANYGATIGGAASTSEPQLLAAEVAAIEFQYYDGTAWMPSWDSSSSGALPTAVEILLTLHTPQAAAAISSQTLAEPQVYRLTVAIPAAPSPGSSTATSADTETDSSAASSSSSGATK